MLALFALGGLGAYLLARHYADQVYDSWLYDSAQSLTVVIRRADNKVLVDLPEPSRRLFVWDIRDTTYFRVTGSSSGLLAGSDEVPLPPDHAPRYDTGLIYDATIKGQPVRVVALQLPASTLGEEVNVYVAESEGKRHALARDVLASLLLFEGLLLVVASLAIATAVSRSLHPLSDIARQLERQDLLQLGPLPLSSVPAEVQPLTRALNSLLTRLETSLASQRRFLADAAHQLRTPLTGLQLGLEQAEAETDWQVLRRLLAKLRSATARAVRLSNQMLALSRAGPDAAAPKSFENVDLCSLVREAGEEWVPVALSKDIELSFLPGESRIEVWGNRTLLQEALNNLIDNAVKYHPGAGVIEVTVSAHPQPSLTVEDDGPGIPEHERELVLERFYRVQQNTAGGAGLGLAIVKEIAQAHGASLRVLAGRSGKGTLVKICFQSSLSG